MSTSKKFLYLATALGLACTPAFADRPAARPPVQLVDAKPQSPYRVELIGQDGDVLPTYLHDSKHYVLGTSGHRYSVRIVNPTSRRVEAVVSIDGLDAVDGRTADYTSKRGYVVPAGGELRLDGFRVSTAEVATFRFSSVKDSYAGRKGQARNVGVIGVAIFEEQEQPVYELPIETTHQHDVKRRIDVDVEVDVNVRGAPSRDRAEAEDAPAAPPARPAEAPDYEPVPTGTAGGGGGRATTKATTTEAPCCKVVKKERPGLGTEFGERRASHVRYVPFIRAHATRPSALAMIHYNDHAGLVALGISIDPPVDEEEIYLRETANPFPEARFAEPPR